MPFFFYKIGEQEGRTSPVGDRKGAGEGREKGRMEVLVTVGGER
jgi:hypothetical protein